MKTTRLPAPSIAGRALRAAWLPPHWRRGRLATVQRSIISTVGIIASALALISLSVAASERPSGLTPQKMDGLLAGRGMGLSMPAEMNGKPGPLHVLEHADALELSEAQRRVAMDLMAAMKAEAIPLGQDVVERESRLDSAFAADGAGAETLVAEIAALQGRLRWVHLRTHLAMTSAMSPEQVARYRHLRHH